MKKVLFTLIGSNKTGMKPPACSILSAVLKSKGHEVVYFDTTFMHTEFRFDYETHSRLNVFKKVDYGRYVKSQGQRMEARKEFLRILDRERPDVIASTCLTDTFIPTIEYLTMAKEKYDVPTIVGGIHPTLNPREVIGEAAVDAICIGEGEEALLEFVDQVENRRITRTDIGNLWIKKENQIFKNPLRPLVNMDDLPFMDYSIYDKRHFHRPYQGKMYVGGDVQEKRGCPRQCTYCANSRLNEIYGGSRINRYSPERFVEEMKYLQREWGIDFCKFYTEDIACVETDMLARLSELYRKAVNIPFVAGAHPQSLTKEKVRWLKNMNCKSISIAIECGNETYRKRLLKRDYSNSFFFKQVELLKEAGIRVHLLNMIGLPRESRKMIDETIAAVRRVGPDISDCGCFFPYRGTPLGDLAIEEGYISLETLKQKETRYNVGVSYLDMPQISQAEVNTVRKQWYYYVNAPEWVLPLIRLCEGNERRSNFLMPFVKKVTELENRRLKREF